MPDDLAPDELTREKAEELLAKPSRRPRAGRRPAGPEIVARDGRYGPYVSEVLEEGSTEKPRTASLFKTMSLDTITLEDALRLLTLPRSIEASDGEEIVVANGRYGPYIKKGKETRSLAERGAALHDHARRGAGAPRAAEGAARARAGEAAAEGSRRRTRDAGGRSWSRRAGSGPT